MSNHCTINPYFIIILSIIVFVISNTGECYRLMDSNEKESSPKIYRASNTNLFNFPDMNSSTTTTTTPKVYEAISKKDQSAGSLNERRSFYNEPKGTFYVTPRQSEFSLFSEENTANSPAMSIDRFTPGEAVASHQLKKNKQYENYQQFSNLDNTNFSSFPPNNNIYPDKLNYDHFSPAIGVLQASNDLSTDNKENIDFPVINKVQNITDTTKEWPGIYDLNPLENHQYDNHDLVIYPDKMEQDNLYHSNNLPVLSFDSDHHQDIEDIHSHFTKPNIHNFIEDSHLEISTPKLPPEARVKKYSYFYIGRKLWYIPLYFTVWFSFYVLWLILKSIARHKVNIPNHYVSRRSLTPDVNNWQPNYNTLDQQTATIMHQIDKFIDKFHTTPTLIQKRNNKINK